MKRIVALAAAFALSACAFTSERGFFSASDASFPIVDGARFAWHEAPDAAPVIVQYRRNGEFYDMAQVGDADPPLQALFVAVPETPEEDYIVQAAFEPDAPARLYAFMWREGDGYRLLLDPRGVAEALPAAAGLDQFCAARPNGECRFDTRESLESFYRRHIYPAFVAGGAAPARYADQVPVSDGPRKKAQDK